MDVGRGEGTVSSSGFSYMGTNIVDRGLIVLFFGLFPLPPSLPLLKEAK